MLVAARRHNFRPNLRARNMTTGRGMADGHIIALSTHHSRCRILFWRLAGSSERAPGHKKRPGLIVVGCESLKRTPKWPYQALTDILTPVDDPQPMTPSDRPVILADIGGTNTRVALARGGQVAHDTIRRFANADHSGLPAILTAYLAEMAVGDCAGACIAAAGPVQDGVAEMTNLSWRITPDDVRGATGATSVSILNDLQAQGHALDRLSPHSLRTILSGANPARPGPRLVIGVGTGFNAAPVHRTHGGLLVAASECGHQSLPLRTDADLRLARFVEAAHGFAGVEDVLSGRGLERLYAFHATEAGAPPDLPAARIMDHIATASDPIAMQTCTTFVTLLGRVTGDLALTHLPFGGLYMIGGVARAFTPYLADGFTAAFRDKGRFSSFMDDFTVQVIEDDYAALEGCAAHLSAEMAD